MNQNAPFKETILKHMSEAKDSEIGFALTISNGHLELVEIVEDERNGEYHMDIIYPPDIVDVKGRKKRKRNEEIDDTMQIVEIKAANNKLGWLLVGKSTHFAFLNMDLVTNKERYIYVKKEALIELISQKCLVDTIQTRIEDLGTTPIPHKGKDMKFYTPYHRTGGKEDEKTGETLQKSDSIVMVPIEDLLSIAEKVLDRFIVK